MSSITLKPRPTPANINASNMFMPTNYPESGIYEHSDTMSLVLVDLTAYSVYVIPKSLEKIITEAIEVSSNVEQLTGTYSVVSEALFLKALAITSRPELVKDIVQ